MPTGWRRTPRGRRRATARTRRATTISGTARCARRQAATRRAQASRSARPSSRTTTSVCAGAPGATGPTACRPYSTTADSRSVKMTRRSATQRSRARNPSRHSTCATRSGVTSRISGDAIPRSQRRLFRRRHRAAQPARRAEAQSLAAGPRRRHDVRQRRQFRAAARRAGRAAAGRRAEVRAGAVAERGRGAARAAGAAADAGRAREALRAHRRQPAAVDDGAVQRRLPGGRRRAADAARLRGPRVAGHRGQLHDLRRVRRRRR